jgi:hypothetical protein
MEIECGTDQEPSGSPATRGVHVHRSALDIYRRFCAGACLEHHKWLRLFVETVYLQLDFRNILDKYTHCQLRITLNTSHCYHDNSNR